MVRPIFSEVLLKPQGEQQRPGTRETAMVFGLKLELT